jgi:uncharacterized membrane protein YhaH (DUF805 family)
MGVCRARRERLPASASFVSASTRPDRATTNTSGPQVGRNQSPIPQHQSRNIMEPRNPYQTPNTAVTLTDVDSSDATSPFSPVGRFGRLSYIAWGFLMGLAAQLIDLAAGGAALFAPAFDAAGHPIPPDIAPATLAVIVIVGLISLVMAVLFMIRRLHDIDASGWFSLLVLVPLVNVFLILFLLLKRGTVGANRFGPKRITRTWEKVVGIIGVVILVLAMIGVIAAIAIPAYLSATGQLPPMGIPSHP